MAATNDPSFTRRTVLASAGAGAGAAALGGTPALAQTGQPKTFVLVHGAWHGGWCWRRVAGPPGKAGPQGVHADAHRRRRALAPHEQGHQSRHPHHRPRQRVQMGGPQGRLPGRALLRRVARLRRAGADRRPRLLDRLARRVQTGERPARVRLCLRDQPQRLSGSGREGRARAAVADGGGIPCHQRKGPRLGRTRRRRRSPTAWRCSRSS